MKKQQWNVLVFPAGMENGIEISTSLKHVKEVTLFSGTSKEINHSFYYFRDNNVIADVRTEGWLEDLNAAIARNNIDLVYPANSIVIDALSANRNKINASVLLPDHSVVELTRSKKKTIALLSGVIPVPKVYSSIEEIDAYPVFSKPDRGYGGQGIKLVLSHADISRELFVDNVVQEHLPGREYTVDCFSDRKAEVVFASARERIRIRMGTAMHAEEAAESVQVVCRQYASKISALIPIRGAWFFQVKEDLEGTLRLLEIDIRIAGTMAFNRCRGINFPLLSIYQHFDLEVSLLKNTFPVSLDRCLKNRFLSDLSYRTVYVDLDDTIIRNGVINTEMIQFLYQCVNESKHIVLLSKSLEKDKNAYLRRFRIENLFDEIHWLEERESKAGYIKDREAIFIDDSFSQRKEISEKLGIPTFDASMIEVLLNDRI